MLYLVDCDKLWQRTLDIVSTGGKDRFSAQAMESNIETWAEIPAQSGDSRAFVGVSKHKQS